MKQTLITMSTFGLILATLFYFGGLVLMVGLWVICLTAIILLSFAIGSWWSRKLMADGAQIAIESASRNDQHDAEKIKALSDLTREAIKAKYDSLPAGNGYPALPASFVEGNFTIAGLDEESEK